MEAIQAEAVRHVLVTQRDELLRSVQRRAGTRVDAEDIVQIASERALARAEQLREPSRAAAWVARIVQNTLRDELRRPRRELGEADSPDEEEAAGCSCVLAQTQRLKPEYSEILRRLVLDGASVALVAAELGVTPNNATVRLHRARRALQKRMADHCGTTRAGACTACGCEERGCCNSSA